MEKHWKKANETADSGAKARQSDAAKTARFDKLLEQNKGMLREGTLEIEGNLTPEEVAAK